MKDSGKITIKNLNVVYGIAMIAVGILFVFCAHPS